MKPTTKTVLRLLRGGPQTTHDLLMAGCGSRYGARIHELREAGFVIREQRLRLPARGSRYTLVDEPERALSETKDPPCREQSDPGSVPYPAASPREGVRSAAPAESHPTSKGSPRTSQDLEVSLFDSSVFAERRSYEDAA